MFTTSYRPRLNGSTERVHQFLNITIGIYCEHHQTLWEEYLQLAVYVHNVTRITGTKNIDPFYLVLGRHAPSPEVLSMELPPSPLTCDDYATYLVCRMHKGQKEFNAIKNDLHHSKQFYCDKNARFIDIDWQTSFYTSTCTDFSV